MIMEIRRKKKTNEKFMSKNNYTTLCIPIFTFVMLIFYVKN